MITNSFQDPSQYTMSDEEMEKVQKYPIYVGKKIPLFTERMDEIHSIFDSAKYTRGAIGDQQHWDDVGVIDTNIRNVEYFCDEEDRYSWIRRTIGGSLMEANSRVYGMNIFGFEIPQFLKYNVGYFYLPHMDTSMDLRNNVMRKLTCILFCSNPGEDFEGGELKILQETVPQEKGLMVVFPSVFTHSVSEVTAGERRSIVTWGFGPPYV